MLMNHRLPGLQPILADLTERFGARIEAVQRRPAQRSLFPGPDGAGPGLLRPALQEVERAAGQPVCR